MKKIVLIGLVYLLVVFSGYGQIRLVSDLIPGAQSSNPFEFIEHDGLLFFRGASASNAVIYVMDSAENITIAWEQSGSAPNNMIVYGNELYFEANNRLHRLNQPYGTGSTIIDTSISVWLLGNVFNGELYFSGEHNQVDSLNPNYELWAFNGTTFRLVEEESSISLNARWFVQHLGELYFVGDEITIINGQPEETSSIYKTDGNTVEVSSFLPTLEISYLTSFQSELYFLGRQGTIPQPYNLWYTNQNATAGFGDELNFAFGLAVFDNELYFFNEDNNTLFKSNQLGSFVPVDIEAETQYPSSAGFPLIGEDFMAFEGGTAALGSELYILGKGTPIAFTEDYNSGTGNFTPVYGAFFNGKLYVTGDDGTGIGRELHVYDPFCTTTVDIEDANFETYIENVLNAGDGIFDNKKVCKELVETITTLSISGLNISNLDGIEAFRDLTFLEASSNQISSVDLSANTNLTSINLSDNQLTTIDVATIPNLGSLIVNNNQLTSLDVSNNSDITEVRANVNALQTFIFGGVTGLTNVQLSGNALSGSYDFSNQLELFQLRVDGNTISNILLPASPQMETFLVSNNPNLLTLDVSVITSNFFDIFQATNLPNLNCIQVRDVDEATNESEWTKDASTEYSLDCVNIPFAVAASVTDAGTGPNYTVQEGQTFNLNFNAGGTAVNGDTYNPLITVTQTGIPDASADFNIVGLNQDITVSDLDPDGIVSFTPNDDGNDTGDEIHTLTVASENTGQYTITEPTSFTITVTDAANSGDPVLLTATIQGVDFDGTDYSIEEGQSFEILVESSNGTDGVIVPISISFSADGTLNLNNVSTDENPFSLTINNNQEADGQFNINIAEDLNVTNEGAILGVTLEKPDGNFEWTDTDGFINKNFQIFIKDKEEYSGDPFLLSVEVLGAEEEENNIEEANETYSVQEGNQVEIRLDAILPNDANDFDFQLQFNFDEGSIPFDSFFDYVLFRNSQGDLLDFEDDEGIQKFVEDFTLSVDNMNPTDAILYVEILPNNLLENNFFILELIPLRPNGFNEDPIITYQGLSNTTESNYNIRFNISDVNNSGDITTIFSNSGSMEGVLDENGQPILDILTVTLFDSDGEFSNDTGDPITIPFSITINNQDLLQLPDGFTDLENLSFTIPPESSSGTFEVIYPNDNNEVPDSYLVNLRETEGVAVNTSPIEISIPDKDKYNVSITLQGNLDRDDVLGFGCCYWYNVERGEIVQFLFDAEKGVVNTNYDAEYEIVQGDSNNGDLDIRGDNLNIGDFLIFGENSPVDIDVIAGIDNSLTMTIKDDFEEDGLIEFGVEFSPLASNYNFSGGRGGSEESTIFYFTIIESIPLSIEVVDQEDEINEDDPANNVTTLRIFLESMPSEGADIDFNVLFATSGDANSDDFSLSSNGTLSYDSASGDGEIFLQENENGVYEAFLTVTALNEASGQEVNEGIEEITFTLLDNFGYKIGNQGFETIRIIDEDQGDIEAILTNFSAIETIFENPASGPTSSTLQIQLRDAASGDVVSLDEDILISFNLLNDNSGQPEAGIDFKIFEGTNGNLVDITNLRNNITIQAGGDSGFLTIEALNNDALETNNEILTIELISGIGYDAVENQNQESISIVSDQRGTEFDPSQVSAVVFSPTCPGFDEGEIVIENTSQFDFTAEIIPDDNNLGPLEIKSDNGKVRFEELKAGDYEIQLRSDNPDIIPPTFILTVRNNLAATNLLTSSIDSSLKMANLMVSGSSRYQVLVNESTYDFKFDDRNENELAVPIENGSNQIIITGEAICQGEIKTELILTDYKAYPNPSENLIYLSGLVPNNEIKLLFFNASGQQILAEVKKSDGIGTLEVDISRMAPGVYIGKVLSSNRELFQIKLLRR